MVQRHYLSIRRLAYGKRLQPIPTTYFPKSLVIDRAKAPLPDLFHASRDLIIASDRARAIFEKLAPREVEFIPVDINKAPTSWLNPFFDAYYSMQECGRTVKALYPPDQVPFYPVGLEPRRRITLRLNLASGYYFINVLARAQRLLWLQMSTEAFPRQEDRVERYGLLQDYSEWKLCERAAGDPLIWHEKAIHLIARKLAAHRQHHLRRHLRDCYGRPGPFRQ